MVNFKRVAFVCGENAANPLEHDAWLTLADRAEGKGPTDKAFQDLLTRAEIGEFGAKPVGWKKVVAFCRDMSRDKPGTVGQWYSLIGDKIEIDSPVGKMIKELIRMAAAGEFKGQGTVRL